MRNERLHLSFTIWQDTWPAEPILTRFMIEGTRAMSFSIDNTMKFEVKDETGSTLYLTDDIEKAKILVAAVNLLGIEELARCL